jgi:serine/threonine protein kinase
MNCELSTSVAGAKPIVVALKQPRGAFDDGDTSRPVIADYSRIEHKDLEDSLDDFAMEAHIHSQMSHTNVVRYMGCIESADGRVKSGLLMESCFLTDDDLSEYCNKGPAELLAFLQMALEAVSHVHSRGYVHMDIKLPNFVGSYGSEAGQKIAKLTDFGLAMEVESTDTVSRGTLTHMAPEVRTASQWHSYRAKSSADIWSFAVMAMQLVGAQNGGPGHQLHKFIRDKADLARFQNDPRQDFFHLVETKLDIDEDTWCTMPGLKGLLQKCLIKAPRPTAQELLEDFNLLLHPSAASRLEPLVSTCFQKVWGCAGNADWPFGKCTTTTRSLACNFPCWMCRSRTRARQLSEVAQVQLRAKRSRQLRWQVEAQTANAVHNPDRLWGSLRSSS